MRYQETGVVTYEDYLTAQWDMLACLTEAGSDVWPEETTFMGYPLLSYSIRLPEQYIEEDGSHPRFDRIMNDCASVYSDPTRELYEKSRRQEAIPRLQREYTPAIVECLTSYGIPTGAAQEFEDLVELSRELVESQPQGSGPDCLELSGFRSEFGLVAPAPEGPPWRP